MSFLLSPSSGEIERERELSELLSGYPRGRPGDTNLSTFKFFSEAISRKLHLHLHSVIVLEPMSRVYCNYLGVIQLSGCKQSVFPHCPSQARAFTIAHWQFRITLLQLTSTLMITLTRVIFETIKDSTCTFQVLN